MAQGNVIAEFVAALRFAPNMAELTDAEKKAKESAERVQKAWEKVGSAIRMIGAGAAAGAGGLFAFVAQSAASAAAIDDAAKKAQAGTREYQRLAFAATKAGSGPQALAGSMRDLDKAITEARKGTGPAAEAFRALGINATALVDLNVEQRFGVIADALAGVTDSSKRTAIAMAVLGGGGADLLPMLEDGASGLQEAGDQAERLGAVLSDEAIAAAAQFDDQIEALKAQLGGMARELGIELIPLVQDAIKHWEDWAKAAVALGVGMGGVQLSTFASQMQGVIGVTNAARLGVVGLTVAVAGLSFSLGTALDNALGLSDALAGVNQEAGGRSNAFLGDLTEAERAQLADATARRDKANELATAGGPPTAFTDLAKKDAAKAQREIEAIHGRAAARNKQTAQNLDAQKRANTTVDRFLGDALIAEGQKGVDAAVKLNIEAGKKKPKKGGKKFEEDIGAGMFEADDLFGDQLRALAGRNGVGDVAVDQALKAAADSLASGSSQEVARQAALGRLGSLAGQDFTSKPSKDPILSEIFGENVPDVELSSLAQGAQPQVLISTINNHFTFDIDQEINGAGDPGAVASMVTDMIRDTFESAIAQSTKTAKVNFAR